MPIDVSTWSFDIFDFSFFNILHTIKKIKMIIQNFSDHLSFWSFSFSILNHHEIDHSMRSTSTISSKKKISCQFSKINSIQLLQNFLINNNESTKKIHFKKGPQEAYRNTIITVHSQPSHIYQYRTADCSSNEMKLKISFLLMDHFFDDHTNSTFE